MNRSTSPLANCHEDKLQWRRSEKCSRRRRCCCDDVKFKCNFKRERFVVDTGTFTRENNQYRFITKIICTSRFSAKRKCVVVSQQPSTTVQACPQTPNETTNNTSNQHKHKQQPKTNYISFLALFTKTSRYYHISELLRYHIIGSINHLICKSTNDGTPRNEPTPWFQQPADKSRQQTTKRCINGKSSSKFVSYVQPNEDE